MSGAVPPMTGGQHGLEVFAVADLLIGDGYAGIGGLVAVEAGQQRRRLCLGIMHRDVHGDVLRGCEAGNEGCGDKEKARAHHNTSVGLCARGNGPLAPRGKSAGLAATTRLLSDRSYPRGGETMPSMRSSPHCLPSPVTAPPQSKQSQHLEFPQFFRDLREIHQTGSVMRSREYRP